MSKDHNFIPDVQVEVSSTFLTYEAGTSSKFYQVLIVINRNTDVSNVIFKWGAIGTTGQSKVIRGVSAQKAEQEARKKIQEKKGKGYKEATTGVTAVNANRRFIHEYRIMGGQVDAEAFIQMEQILGEEILQEHFEELGIFTNSLTPKKSTPKVDDKKLNAERVAHYNNWAGWA